MAKPEHVRCGNCIFFEMESETTGEGYCHRNPPKIVDMQIKEALSLIHWAVASGAGIVTREKDQASIDPDLNSFQWPDVNEVNWCGDFRSEWPS